MIRQGGGFLRGVFALAWLVLVFAGFLLLNPQHFAAASILLERITQLGVAVLIFLTAYLLGGHFFDRLKTKFSSFTEKSLFSLGAGLCFLSTLILILISFGVMAKSIYFLIVLTIIVFSFRKLQKLIQAVVGASKNVSFNLCTISLLAFLLLVLLSSFAPPISYDALEYHLGGPSTYLREGKLVFLPDNVYANFPALTETLFTLGMILKDDIAAKLIHFLFGVVSALAVYGLARAFFSRKIAPLAALIFFSYSQVGLLASQAYVDLALTFFLILALHAFIRWIDNGKTQWLIISAFMGGAASSVKYSGLIFGLLILGAGIVVREFYLKKIKLVPKNISLFAAIFFIVISPWLVKNLIYTGNPVYPFLQPLLGGGWSEVQYAKFLFHHRPFETGFWQFVFSPSAPWRITFTEGRISPLFLLFAPISLLFLFKKENADFPPGLKKRTLAIVLAYSALYYAFWLFFTHQNIRFLVPLSGLIAVLASLGFYSLRKIKGAAISAGVVLVLGLTYNFYLSALLASERVPLRVVTGRESRDEYLIRHQPHYAAVKFMNENLPLDSRILFIGEARVHYIEREVVANTVFDRSVIKELLEISEGDIEELRRRIQEMGITYVFLNELELERLKANYGYLAEVDWKEFKRYKFLKEIFSAELPDGRPAMYVYEVR